MTSIVDHLDRSNRWFSLSPRDGRRKTLIVGLLLTSVAMIGLPVMILIVASGGFILGRPIGPATFPIAWALTAAVAVPVAHRAGIPRPHVAAAVLAFLQLAILATTLWVVGSTYDLSFDGQWFNQEAVLVLDSGWNPLKGPAPAEETIEVGARSKVDGYTKAAWICDTSVVSLTGRIEHGKVFDGLLLLAAFAAASSAALCYSRLSIPWALAFGLLIAANPTALNQLTTHMVDGDLGCGLIVLASGLLIMTIGPQTGLATLAAGLGLVWTVGVKFSGGPMAAVLLVAALGIALVVDRERITSRRVAGLATAAAAAAVLNLNPFLTNMLWFEHPLYPYFGPQKSDALFSGGQGGLISMAMSMASRPSRVGNLQACHRSLMAGEQLTLPFVTNRRDFLAIRMPGLHMGAWGPLFSGMLVLGFLILVLESGGRLPHTVATVLLIATVVASAAANQYPWVARYVPQTWWIPLLTLPLALTSPRWIARALGWALALAAAITGVITLALHLDHSYSMTRRTRGQLVGLGTAGQPIQVSYGYLRSNRRWLAELGFEVHEVSDRAHSLDVILGRNRARLLGHRIKEVTGGDEHRLTVRWRPDPMATFHRIRLAPIDPRNPSADISVTDLESSASRLRLPITEGRWMVSVSGCNSLGCGPTDTAEISVPP